MNKKILALIAPVLLSACGQKTGSKPVETVAALNSYSTTDPSSNNKYKDLKLYGLTYEASLDSTAPIGDVYVYDFTSSTGALKDLKYPLYSKTASPIEKILVGGYFNYFKDSSGGLRYIEGKTHSVFSFARKEGTSELIPYKKSSLDALISYNIALIDSLYHATKDYYESIIGKRIAGITFYPQRINYNEDDKSFEVDNATYNYTEQSISFFPTDKSGKQKTKKYELSQNQFTVAHEYGHHIIMGAFSANIANYSELHQHLSNAQKMPTNLTFNAINEGLADFYAFSLIDSPELWLRDYLEISLFRTPSEKYFNDSHEEKDRKFISYEDASKITKKSFNLEKDYKINMYFQNVHRFGALFMQNLYNVANKMNLNKKGRMNLFMELIKELAKDEAILIKNKNNIIEEIGVFHRALFAAASKIKAMSAEEYISIAKENFEETLILL
jgi:hypothetical protein